MTEEIPNDGTDKGDWYQKYGGVGGREPVMDTSDEERGG